jgi:hypothetical protein
MFHRSLSKIAVPLIVLLVLAIVVPSPMSARSNRYSVAFNNLTGAIGIRISLGGSR